MNDTPAIEIQIDPRWAEAVDAVRLERAVRAVFEVEKIEGEAGLTLVVVGDEEMTRLHESFRQEPGTTDVLTFPYEDEGLEEMQGFLGDVILCFPQAARQAADEGHATQDELDLLAAHGTLHLLGYDDESPAARAAMWPPQRKAMSLLGLAHVAPD